MCIRFIPGHGVVHHECKFAFSLGQHKSALLSSGAEAQPFYVSYCGFAMDVWTINW